jgi:hypothetical protein
MATLKTTVVNLKCEQYDVRIDRQTVFGNPFHISASCNREQSIEQYRVYFLKRVANDAEFRNAVLALRGKRLGCWCKPAACHGDVIAQWVDSYETPPTLDDGATDDCSACGCHPHGCDACGCDAREETTLDCDTETGEHAPF